MGDLLGSQRRSQSFCSAANTNAQNEVLERLREEYKCGICMELSYKPPLTSCGHVFCMGCFQTSMRVSRVCPICRASQDIFWGGWTLSSPSSMAILRPNTVLWNTIQTLFPEEVAQREQEELEKHQQYQASLLMPTGQSYLQSTDSVHEELAPVQYDAYETAAGDVGVAGHGVEDGGDDPLEHQNPGVPAHYLYPYQTAPREYAEPQYRDDADSYVPRDSNAHINALVKTTVSSPSTQTAELAPATTTTTTTNNTNIVINIHNNVNIIINNSGTNVVNDHSSFVLNDDQHTVHHRIEYNNRSNNQVDLPSEFSATSQHQLLYHRYQHHPSPAPTPIPTPTPPPVASSLSWQHAINYRKQKQLLSFQQQEAKRARTMQLNLDKVWGNPYYSHDDDCDVPDHNIYHGRHGYRDDDDDDVCQGM